jgi:hypothetical protein
MAERTRSSARRKAATWSPSFVALVACGVAACSSGTAQTSGPVSDPNPAQEPPGNPQDALLNGEVPLGNAEQPPGNAQGAPANPEQPSATNAGSNVFSVGNSCSSVCVNIGVNCTSACARLCGQLTSVVGQCVAAASRYVSCLSGISISCSGNGRLQINGPQNDCESDGNAVTACVDAANSAASGSGPAAMTDPAR